MEQRKGILAVKVTIEAHGHGRVKTDEGLVTKRQAEGGRIYWGFAKKEYTLTYCSI